MDIRPYNPDDPNCCSEEFLDECAQKLKVAGHPMRLRLLCRIAQEGEPCVSDLWTCLDQPQPVISQHLAVLKQRNIVTSRVQGNRRIYTIIDPFIRQIVGSLIDTPMPVSEDSLAHTTR